MERTDDWCLTVKNGIIKEEKIGGTDCYQMKGISYWNAEDGKKLATHLEETYNSPGGKELYWEQVSLVKYNDCYKVEICNCNNDDIIEIDTFFDLKRIDKTYDI